jgi:hypothetical protein
MERRLEEAAIAAPSSTAEQREQVLALGDDLELLVKPIFGPFLRRSEPKRSIYEKVFVLQRHFSRQQGFREGQNEG